MSTLNLSQAAKYLGISEKSIRRYIHAGRLPFELVKGKKGEEYRFESQNLDLLNKPERGRKRKSSKTTPVSRHTMSGKKPTLYVGKNEKIEEKTLDHAIKKDFIHIRQLIDDIKEKRAHKATEPTPTPATPDTFSAQLLTKYENALIKIGKLESEINSQENRYLIREENYKKKIAEQEQLIQELYQIIRFYEQ